MTMDSRISLLIHVTINNFEAYMDFHYQMFWDDFGPKIEIN